MHINEFNINSVLKELRVKRMSRNRCVAKNSVGELQLSRNQNWVGKKDKNS